MKVAMARGRGTTKILRGSEKEKIPKKKDTANNYERGGKEIGQRKKGSAAKGEKEKVRRGGGGGGGGWWMAGKGGVLTGAAGRYD